MIKAIIASALVLGVPVSTKHDNTLYLGQTATGGTKISAQSINAAKYTGWIYVGDVKQLVLAIDYTNSAGTAVVMACHTALTNTGANGTGYFLPAITRTGTSAAPVETTAPASWSNPVSGDEDWTWLIDNIPMPFINCNFTATSGDANDKVTVYTLGVSP
jgi:hypothetical protein